MTTALRLSCIVALLLLWSISAVFAASVRIVPSGSGSYIIQGDVMDGVSGIDLSLSYDRSVMSSPTVTQGGLISGAMMAANTTGAGSIRIAIVSGSTFSGSGPIATVTFATTKSSGTLMIASVNLIDTRGGPISAAIGSGDSGTNTNTVTDTTTTNTTTSTTTSTTTPSTIGSTTGTATPVYAGTMTMPTDAAAAQGVPKPAAPPGPATTSATENAPAPTPSAEQPTPEKTEEPKKAVAPRSITYTPVLERFQTFHGTRSPAALIALFSGDMPSSISQNPAVVLSDGTTHVRITITLAAPDGHSPNFALNGAKLIALAKGEQPEVWVVEALPQRDTVKASLTILNGTEEILFPLVVSPPVKADIFSEAEFAAYLKNRSKTADLNKDGSRDYVDDYIYTANYLVRKKGIPSNTAPATKKP